MFINQETLSNKIYKEGIIELGLKIQLQLLNVITVKQK